jgi:hypothetical protein
MRPLPWCWDKMFDRQKAAWLAHNQTCESLDHFWLARRGGASCPSDLWDCTSCGHTFYIEGVCTVNWDDEDADEIRLCACCAKARGYVVSVNQWGISAESSPRGQTGGRRERGSG